VAQLFCIHSGRGQRQAVKRRELQQHVPYASSTDSRNSRDKKRTKGGNQKTKRCPKKGNQTPANGKEVNRKEGADWGEKNVKTRKVQGSEERGK